MSDAFSWCEKKSNQTRCGVNKFVPGWDDVMKRYSLSADDRRFTQMLKRLSEVTESNLAGLIDHIEKK